MCGLRGSVKFGEFFKPNIQFRVPNDYFPLSPSPSPTFLKRPLVFSSTLLSFFLNLVLSYSCVHLNVFFDRALIVF